MAEESPVRAVMRAMEILLAVASRGPATLADICSTADVSKATGHRLLRTLSHRELVIQDLESGFYALGPGALVIADALTRGACGLGLVASHILEDLRDLSGETVALHTRIDAHRVCVAEKPSLQDLRYTAGVGHSVPVHSGSAGKVLLAFLPEDERRELVQRLSLSPVTERTITDRGILEAELNVVARRGHAISVGERLLGASGLSVPIFGADDRVLASLSLIGPDNRLTRQRMDDLLPDVKKAAVKIHDQLAVLSPTTQAADPDDTTAEDVI